MRLSADACILSCCCGLIYHLFDQIISSWWDFAGSSSCCCFDSSLCFLLWSLVDPLQQLWSSNALQTLVLVDPYNFERSPSPGWSRATISFSDSTSAYSLPSVESLFHLSTSAIVRSKGQSYRSQLWRASLVSTMLQTQKCNNRSIFSVCLCRSRMQQPGWDLFQFNWFCVQPVSWPSCYTSVRRIDPRSISSSSSSSICSMCAWSRWKLGLGSSVAYSCWNRCFFFFVEDSS